MLKPTIHGYFPRKGKQSLQSGATRTRNDIQLQLPDCILQQKPTWPSASCYSYDLSSEMERMLFRAVLHNLIHKLQHMLQPSAPRLVRYLASSWLIIFHPQVEPSPSSWERGIEHMFQHGDVGRLGETSAPAWLSYTSALLT